MVGTLFLALLPFRPVAFLDQPIDAEVRKGIEVYRAGKGLDRVLQDDKAVLRTRLVRLSTEEIERVVWLSPSLVSRWLGYLWALEKWPDGELERRWKDLQGSLDGRLTYVVELASYPRDKGPRSLEAAFQPDSTWEGLEFLLTADGSQLPMAPGPSGLLGLSRAPRGGEAAPGTHQALRIEPHVSRFASITAREPIRLSGLAWVSQTPLAPWLEPKSGSGWAEPLAPLGEYEKAWFLVQAPAPAGIHGYGDLQVRVLSRQPERCASFDMLGKGRKK